MADYYAEEYVIDYENLIDLLCPNMEVEGGHNMTVENRTSYYISECDNLSKILDFYDYSSWNSNADKIYVPVIFSLILVVGLIGNGLVVYVILKSASLKISHCVTNLFLFNLALADLLFLGVCVPFTGLFVVLPSWPFGEVMCKFVYYFMMVTMGTTILTMTAMTIDRYFAVVKPLQSKSMRTPQRTIVILVSIWIINSASLIPLLQIYKIRSFMDNSIPQEYCLEVFETDNQRRIYYMTIAVIFYLVPFCVIALAYGLMAGSLWAGVSPAFKRVNRAKALRYRKKVAKMMLVVVTVFAVCWFPIHALHIKNEFVASSASSTATLLKTIAHCMAYMNSAMNPIIYAFMNENFRKSFKAAFTCKQIKLHMIFLIQELEAIHIPNRASNNRSKRLTQKAANQGSSAATSSGNSGPTPLMSTDLNSNSNPEVQTTTTGDGAPTAGVEYNSTKGEVVSLKLLSSSLGNGNPPPSDKVGMELTEVVNSRMSEAVSALKVTWLRNGTVTSKVEIHQVTATK